MTVEEKRKLDNLGMYTVTEETLAIREIALKEIAQCFIRLELPLSEGITIALNTVFNCYLNGTKGDKVEAVRLMVTETPGLMIRMCAAILQRGDNYSTIDVNKDKHGMH